jgi:imidazoleglycerol phosphate synthase glutamine amidotransferase subunit HisH
VTFKIDDEDSGERNLMPRKIVDDQIIKKHKHKKLLNYDKQNDLKDEDLKRSIWDEDSILKNDIEQQNDTPVLGKKAPTSNLVNQISSLTNKITEIKNSSLETNKVTDVSVKPLTSSSTNKENDSKSENIRKLTLFDDYQIRKRYTLNPEEDYSKVEMIEMPKQPKRELIVGILTLPISSVLKRKIRNNIKSKVSHEEFLGYTAVLDDMTFYPSSYAKWLEHNGVKTVPISINNDITQIYDMIDKLDGLLLTGGATPLFLRNNLIQVDNKGIGSYTKIKHPSDYLTIVNKIITYAKKKNLVKPFPVWGTCLGFESTILNESNLSMTLNFVDNNNKNLSNKINGDPAAYRMTSFLTEKEQQILSSTNSSFFNHDYAFSFQNFKRNQSLSDQYDVVGTSTAGALKIVSMIEHKTLPIYGVQFHPEKIIYENSGDNLTKVVKTDAAKQVSNKLSLFFISGIVFY